MEIDDRIFVVPLPENYKDQRHGRDHGQPHDEVRVEPVVALPLVEDYLQGSQAEGYETEAGVIDVSFAELAAPEIGRILNET